MYSHGKLCDKIRRHFHGTVFHVSFIEIIQHYKGIPLTDIGVLHQKKYYIPLSFGHWIADRLAFLNVSKAGISYQVIFLADRPRTAFLASCLMIQRVLSVASSL